MRKRKRMEETSFLCGQGYELAHKGDVCRQQNTNMGGALLSRSKVRTQEADIQET